MRRSFSLLRSDNLYHFLVTDTFDTPEYLVNAWVEEVLKTTAEAQSWTKYEWVKHKIVSEFKPPGINYYIVEVRGKERE